MSVFSNSKQFFFSSGKKIIKINGFSTGNTYLKHLLSKSTDSCNLGIVELWNTLEQFRYEIE